MGTRGLLGFIIRAQRHAAYNHYDSYPEGLGVGIVKFLLSLEPEDIAEMDRKLREVTVSTHLSCILKRMCRSSDMMTSGLRKTPLQVRNFKSTTPMKASSTCPRVPVLWMIGIACSTKYKAQLHYLPYKAENLSTWQNLVMFYSDDDRILLML